MLDHIEKDKLEKEYSVTIAEEDNYFKIKHNETVIAVFITEQDAYYFLSGFIVGTKISRQKYVCL